MSSKCLSHIDIMLNTQARNPLPTPTAQPLRSVSGYKSLTTNWPGSAPRWANPLAGGALDCVYICHNLYNLNLFARDENGNKSRLTEVGGVWGKGRERVGEGEGERERWEAQRSQSEFHIELVRALFWTSTQSSSSCVYVCVRVLLSQQQHLNYHGQQRNAQQQLTTQTQQQQQQRQQQQQHKTEEEMRRADAKTRNIFY